MCAFMCYSECLFLSRVIQGEKEKILAYLLSSFIQKPVVQQSMKQRVTDRRNAETQREEGAVSGKRDYSFRFVGC